MTNSLPLPFPWVPGSGPIDGTEFQDRVQQNFDKLAIAVGQLTQRRNVTVGTSTTVTVNSTTPTTIATADFTANGGPVLVAATGDMNALTTPTTWNNIQLYRGSTAIGKLIIAEARDASVSQNVPWGLVDIDEPAAGSYTYTVKAYRGSGDAQYGETGDIQAPSLVVIQL